MFIFKRFVSFAGGLLIPAATLFFAASPAQARPVRGGGHGGGHGGFHGGAGFHGGFHGGAGFHGRSFAAHRGSFVGRPGFRGGRAGVAFARRPEARFRGGGRYYHPWYRNGWYGYYPGYAGYNWSYPWYGWYDYSYPWYDSLYTYGYNPGYYVYSPSETILESSPTVSTLPSTTPATPVATFTVNVPPDATIWIDGQQMTETGSTREFVTPPLTPGQDYRYQMRAHWMVNNQPVEESRTVVFHAGDHLNVDFMTPTVTQTQG